MPPPHCWQGASPAGLQKNLTLAGLGTASAGPLDSVVSSKPAWETGARAAISLRKKPAAVQAAPAWKLSVDDEDDDIIDDEQLLTAEDLVRPAPAGEVGLQLGFVRLAFSVRSLTPIHPCHSISCNPQRQVAAPQ